MSDLVQMIDSKPIISLFIFFVIIAVIIFLAIGIYKLINKAITKGIKVKGVEIPGDDNDENFKEIRQMSTTQDITGLINLIIDLPDIAIKKNESLYSLKEQLITEQKQDFCARLKSYRVDIRNAYQELIAADDIHDNRVRLFNYWFTDLFEDVEDEILVILRLNGLNEKSAEQLEDTLTRLYDTTFSRIMESVDSAPKFIDKPLEVRKLLERTKSKYREALQSSLNHAKKLRIEYQSKFDKVEEDYLKNREAIIARDFPNIDLGVIKSKC